MAPRKHSQVNRQAPLYDVSASSRPDVVGKLSNVFGHPTIFADCGNDVGMLRTLLKEYLFDKEKRDKDGKPMLLGSDEFNPPPKLLRACQRYVARFQKRVEILERRGGESAEAIERRTHWATKATFFFDRPFATHASRIYFVIQTAIIVFSCIAVILQSVPRYNPQLFEWYRIFWAQGDILSSGLLLLDRFAQITAGLLDPLGGSPKILKRCKQVLLQPSVIVDLLACLVPLIMAFSSTPGSDGSILDLFVLLRVYRILMSLRHFDAFEDLMDTLRSSAPALAAPLVGLFVILFGVSSIVYTFEGGTYVEDKAAFMTRPDDCIMSAEYLKGRTECTRVESKFVSAVHTIWFTLITFLTVGYGDLVPLTQGGRLVAAVAIFIGMLFVAIPIAIVGSNFTETVERLRTERLLVVQWMEREREAPLFEREREQLEEQLTEPAPVPCLSLLRFLRMNLKRTVINLRNPKRDARYLCELYLERVKEVFNDPAFEPLRDLMRERARLTKRPYSARLQLLGTPHSFPPVPLMRPVSVTVGSSPGCDMVLGDMVTKKLRGAATAGGRRLVRVPQMVASRHATISLLPFAGTAESVKVEPVQPFQAQLVGAKGNRIHFAQQDDAFIYLGHPPPTQQQQQQRQTVFPLDDDEDEDDDGADEVSAATVPYCITLDFGRRFGLLKTEHNSLARRGSAGFGSFRSPMESSITTPKNKKPSAAAAASL